MRAVIQRVVEAQVSVNGKVIGRIGPGLVILLGVVKEDTGREADRLAERILTYRIFDDENGRMNRSVQDVRGQILAVSQFTVVADVAKGTRPSFTPAASPEEARALYERFINRMASSGLSVETGRFGSRMIVSLHNDGPVTFVLES
jgi:D-aminoacyl-tRNA deacylase